MRILVFLSSIFISTPVFAAGGLEQILKRSTFAADRLETLRIDGVDVPYDPVMISVVASLRSRLPEKKESWQPLTLPAGPKPGPCTGPVKALLRKSRSGSPYTFVILPGSFASASRGSFTNQTTASLDRIFGDPTIITFAGYLSTEFLKHTCFKIPWDGIGIGQDIYARLSVWMNKNPQVGRSRGVIGYSGGGLLAISMLAADAANVRTGGARIFERGGIAFSPVLHGRTAFSILDTRHAQSRIEKTLTLTTMDFKNVLFLSKNFGPPAWWQIPGLYNENPTEFTDRAYSEFTVSDLSATLRAVGASSERAFRGFYEAHVLEGFAAENPGVPAEAGYDAATDVGRLLTEIDAPLFIYSSQDDPVLATAGAGPQAEAVTKVMDQGRVNPAVQIFNPKFGAHTGALLDVIFDDLLKENFQW